MNDQLALFKRLKDIKEYWVQTSVEGLNKDTDLIWSECEVEYI